MLFNSYFFILVFLPITVAGYFWLTHQRILTAARVWLVTTSLFFYGWWNISFLPIVLISIFFNFAIGSTLIQQRSIDKRLVTRKWLFRFGLVANVLTLVYFKYTDFFIANANQWLGTQWPLLHILLPLGISFFTITQITYLVDCYEGLVNETDFLNYMLFVTFFPHLLMGPILHHKQMMPQFASLRNKIWQPRNVMQGLVLFTLGLGKKVLLADAFAVWAKQGYDVMSTLTMFEAWVTTLSYTFQLYFDFSGYSDMALGVALLFNIKLPVNFNTPLRAIGIIDFWQRWHISLTQFITTYLYTPILMSFARITFRHAAIATIISMLIAGLWHEAGWGFLAFYFLHGIALVLNHWWKRKKYKMPRFLGWFLTFQFVNLTLILPRSHDWLTICKLMKGLVGGNGVTVSSPLLGMTTGMTLALAFFIAVVGPNSQNIARVLKLTWVNVCLVVVIFLIALLRLNLVSEFLYFNF